MQPAQYQLRFKLKERIADNEFRESRRISLIEVANETGIGRITLSRMLNRGTHVRSDTLDRLCTYFGCRIEELVAHIPDAPAEKAKAKKSR
ncbi:MAG: helix-turn-helix transcriptional regulator [Proteobacteria bacterium]|nr:helix-turn-helix transcriptional regulator [Pseudomonadota bacterium]